MSDAPAFDIDAWLDEQITVSARYAPAVVVPRHERICFLVAANGGFDVKGWGMLGSAPGGHQTGLDQEDAVHLIQYSSFLRGLATAGIDWEKAFMPHWDAYRVRLTTSALPPAATLN